MKRFKTHFNESKDTHCSDKCCGADVKAADCDCPADCPHCNCNAKNEATNEDVIAIINEHNITLEQLENMTEEELNELLGKVIGGAAKVIGGVAKGAGRLAKKAVVNKQGNIRGTKAASQDRAGNRAEKQAKKREAEYKRKKRISDMKQRASDLDKKIADLNNK